MVEDKYQKKKKKKKRKKEKKVITLFKVTFSAIACKRLLKWALLKR